MKKIIITGVITGLYGCNCHSFESWDDEKAHSTQKLKIGDKVKHRCRGVEGIVSREREKDGGNYYLVQFGTRGVASDHEMAHAANLVKIKNQN